MLMYTYIYGISLEKKNKSWYKNVYNLINILDFFLSLKEIPQVKIFKGGRGGCKWIELMERDKAYNMKMKWSNYLN